MMVITFHLTDICNIKCKGCHWFSSEIKIVEDLNWTHYINWVIKYKNQIQFIKLSGGEPTLYKHFLTLVDNLPKDVYLIINTNGTNLNILSQIKRKENIELRVSENREIDDSFEEKIINLGFHCSFYSFNGLGRKQNLNNETEFGQTHGKILIGNKGRCFFKEIRFAADGWAYNCELGLRSKREDLRLFSLWEGEPLNLGKECIVSDKCASNFLNENEIKNF
jgi:hypothetical protein